MSLSATESAVVRLRERLSLRESPTHASLVRPSFPDVMTPESFRLEATAFLVGNSELLLDSIVLLVGLSGRWHPSGYAVFTIGGHETLGTLRLHVWPAGIRRAEVRPAGVRDIHDHALHIRSLVVLGTYRDVIYRIDERDVDPAAPGALHVYTPPAGRSGSQLLAPSGEVVTVAQAYEREVDEGLLHFIPEGQFHAPTISDESVVATISFSSPPVRAVGPRILIPSSVGEIRGMRAAVSEADRVAIEHQLVGALDKYATTI